MSSKVQHFTVSPLKLSLHPVCHLTILCSNAVLTTWFPYCWEADLIFMHYFSHCSLNQAATERWETWDEPVTLLPFLGTILYEVFNCHTSKPPLRYMDQIFSDSWETLWKMWKKTCHDTGINWIEMIIYEESQSLSVLKEPRISLDWSA